MPSRASRDSPSEPDLSLIALAQAQPSGQKKRFKKGNILHWQGDPVEFIYVVVKGAIKVSSSSVDGKTYTYTIVGPGGLVGAEAFLLDEDHETLSEAVEETEVVAFLADEFQRILETNASFSLSVMRNLARDVHFLGSKVRDLTLLDVQQRVKSSLIELANEHGIPTEKGIRIDLDLTHEEIGEMVAANRTTVTAVLGELRRQGYLWKERGHLFILPPQHIEILDRLDQAVLEGSEDDARHWALQAVDQRIDPLKALDALTAGMRRVDRKYARNEIDVSDVIIAAYALKGAIPIIEDEIARTERLVPYLGTIVIGTVAGDVHDIGRTLVAMLLKARGFKVVDLGIDVPTAHFVEAVQEHRAQILAMSTLMTATILEPAKVIRALVHAGLRDHVKVIVGGGAVSQKLSEEMGADGYELSAHGAAELAWRLSRTS